MTTAASNLIFIAALAGFSGATLAWGISRLHRERWQFLAAIPRSRRSDGSWRCVNITYYGALTAFACVCAVALGATLLSALGVGAAPSLFLVCALLAICVPAAKIVAVIVERNFFRFTVGGAAFSGIVCAPLVAALAGFLFREDGAGAEAFPVVPACAALAAAYAFGEGVGRLACLSYGCCYGRKIATLRSAAARKFFSALAVRFDGECKKAVYAGGCGGEALVPVQAMSAIVNTGTALASTALLASGSPRAALIFAVAGTQLWRFFSEFLRDDDRGKGKISSYQKMALVAVAWTVAAVFVFGDGGAGTPARPPVLAEGLRIFLSPATILALQALFAAVLVYTGTSRMTTSTARFSVVRSRI